MIENTVACRDFGSRIYGTSLRALCLLNHHTGMAMMGKEAFGYNHQYGAASAYTFLASYSVITLNDIFLTAGR